jgi:lysophospholipase L1-like esterase
MRWFHWLAAGIVATGLVLAAVLAASRGQSDPILAVWTEIGGYPWLKPNLRSAKVVVIDRPHRVSEAMQSRAWLTAIGRTRSYALTTNSQRLRAPELSRKRAGTKRILVIGESVAHGWGLADEDTWVVKLQAELQAGGQDVEVINAGVPSAFSETMRGWCVAKATPLEPDLIVWMRRAVGPGGAGSLAQGARDCAAATRAKIVLVLPPISTFDAHGATAYRSEAPELQRLMPGTDVIELTDTFRDAQRGRGEVLEHRGTKAVVVDQESGAIWLEAPWSEQDLDPAIYALFESEPDVREALFFDEGHPDAEGATLLAHTLAVRLGPTL